MFDMPILEIKASSKSHLKLCFRFYMSLISKAKYDKPMEKNKIQRLLKKQMQADRH